MKVATISKKLIKPHTPTPQNLKNHYISFLDQIMPSVNISVVLFYESKHENNRQLEESLAKILVQFYPLAGRYIKNDHLIDCSDQGAMFVEAEALDAELTIDLVVKNREIHKLNNLFPGHDFPANPVLLSIQVTDFPSGGLAIAISVSHTVFDMSSLGTFITAWSDATNPDGKIAITPSFDLPSLLPYKDRYLSSCNTDYDHSTNEVKHIVAKRFLFDKVALTKLRSKLSPNRNGKAISRVRAVCAVIAKALTRLDRVKHGKTRDFMISQPINMRERTVPPQPKHACGNLALLSFTRPVAASEGEEIGMQELVNLIGDAVEKSIAYHTQILSPDQDGRDIIDAIMEIYIQHVSNPNTNNIGFSDWSKFGFYEADFGWGKPFGVSIGPLSITNSTALLSNKDGDGIEAWVYLNQDDMHYFEQDEEIKYFTI